MMISIDKVKAYDKLVNKINNYDKSKLDEMGLVACSECREVNFWTYWEGGRSHLNADILLVGQDWGSINYDAEPVTNMIVNHPDELDDFRYMHKNENLTNKHICKLMPSIYPNINLTEDYNTQEQLFFTNFVPWYRKPGAKISGGYDKRWTEPSADIFTDLVSIINPMVIMCLGQKTYNNVCDALNMSSAKRGINYSAIVANGCHETVINEKSIAVFPLMHPGYWGTRARSLDTQKEDWAKVKEIINAIQRS